MGLLEKIKKALNLVDGHEDTVAKKVSDKTGIDEKRVKQGIDKAQDAVDTYEDRKGDSS